MRAESEATVIADDLTGAAEVGGTAFSHGIPAEIQIDRVLPVKNKLNVVDADTRCRSQQEAAHTVQRAAGDLLRQAPSRRIFKKVDSLLRGNVLSELTALLRVSGAPRILLVPANPALGRTIRAGTYLIQGVPIDATEFARDPRHPVSSSKILDMLAPFPESPPIALASPGEPVPLTGIVVAQSSSVEDLDHWARIASDDKVWAGAAAFFAALLRAEGYKEHGQDERTAVTNRTLLVSGSASDVSQAHLRSLLRFGIPVISMPPALFSSGTQARGNWLQEWAAQISGALQGCAQVAVTIGQFGNLLPGQGGRLARHLAEVVQAVLERTAVDHLWVEGGETASRIVRHLGWERLEVSRQVAPGVVELKPEPARPFLTVKPGSYPWPSAIRT
jgi:D-threonate/D-erythronate kinase